MIKPLTKVGPSDIQIKRHWCKACGICAALCPKQVLGSDEQGKAIVVAPENCTNCQMCEMHCPDFAISVGVKDDD